MENSQPKLGIGALVLSPTRGAIVSGSIRTHLHNASISVNVNTTIGAVAFVVYVHATRQVVTIEGLTASGRVEVRLRPLIRFLLCVQLKLYQCFLLMMP